ncbi:MAG: opioid growth factor receptor-related protein [Phycisphaerales bacterium]|nr:opioid growth factor receptor-related protein [Phycisphaerales bacterium]
MKEDTRLLDFYEGRGEDHRGRTLSDVHRFPVELLEHEHDYIQWLFPLRSPSPVNPEAPTLSEQDITRFRSDDTLKARLRQSLELMLDFYGLRMSERDGVAVVGRANTFALRAENWLTPGNHNFLRITRILKSLTILGQGSLARAFLECLATIFDDHRGIIGDRTWRFWSAAVADED